MLDQREQKLTSRRAHQPMNPTEKLAHLEAGIQFHLPTYRDRTVPELLKLGKTVHDAGFQQIWVTDNLQSRNCFTVLTALATAVPVRLGTAVMVQYFRNPVDAADSVAAISELMAGRELSIGIARGNAGTPRFVQTLTPVTILRETVLCLKRLLGGDRIEVNDYPALSRYFHYTPGGSFKLNFTPPGPVRLYCGGNGPLALAIAGEHMDGVVFGGTLLAAAGAGRLRELLDTADAAAAKAERPELRRVAEVKISVARDRQAARAFVRHSVGSRILSLRQRGYTNEDYSRLGVAPADVDRLQQAEHGGAPRETLGDLVTDAMIDAIFVAGEPAFCKERMQQVCAMARDHGFHQLMFSEIGPDVEDALQLMGDHVLPAL